MSFSFEDAKEIMKPLIKKEMHFESINKIIAEQDKQIRATEKYDTRCKLCREKGWSNVQCTLNPEHTAMKETCTNCYHTHHPDSCFIPNLEPKDRTKEMEYALRVYINNCADKNHNPCDCLIARQALGEANESIP